MVFLCGQGLAGSLLWGHVMVWWPEAGDLGGWSLVETDAAFRLGESVLFWLDLGSVSYIGIRSLNFNTAPMA